MQLCCCNNFSIRKICFKLQIYRFGLVYLRGNDLLNWLANFCFDNSFFHYLDLFVMIWILYAKTRLASDLFYVFASNKMWPSIWMFILLLSGMSVLHSKLSYWVHFWKSSLFCFHSMIEISLILVRCSVHVLCVILYKNFVSSLCVSLDEEEEKRTQLI